MNHDQIMQYVVGLGAPVWIPVVGLTLIIVVIWSLFWKGLALWHSAQRGQPWWFLIVLLVSSAGIIEIIYLFFVAKIKPSKLFSKHHSHQ